MRKKISIIFTILFFVFVFVSCATFNSNGRQALDLWTDNAPAKAALIKYVEAITDKNSEDFIPEERRIAVFDMDGTLICETDPNYFDHILLAYRVLEDPKYKDHASVLERNVANRIIGSSVPTNLSDNDKMIEHGKAVASAFKDMTLEELNEYIQKFKAMEQPGYQGGLTRGNSFYLPMVQVVKYLQENGFTIYVISGTDRFISRAIFYKNMLDIDPSNIIGSDVSLVATNQGDTDGLSYTFRNDDKVVIGGGFLIKNLKMNKVSAIVREIGVQPVLAFGNSSSDFAMAQYTVSENPYPSLAFMLCCDDLVRENGNEVKAQQMYDSCAQYGWIPVSMKNDWITIYGSNITRK